MKDIILTGAQMEAFRDALAAAFPNQSLLEQMLLFKLNNNLKQIVARGSMNQMIFDLILIAEAEGWLYRLLFAARQQVPGNWKLKEFEQSVSLSTREFTKSGLEAKIRQFDQFLILDTWLGQLSELEKQVCRVEVLFGGEQSYGTGFLIAPNLVLTNYHVVESVIRANASSNHVKLRFDYKKLAKQSQDSDGIVYNLASDWLLSHSPYSQADLGNSNNSASTEELDYAILRLEQPLTSRGYIKIPSRLNAASFQRNYRANAPLFIIQHPEGSPLKLALDTQSIIGFNENKTRFYYKTLTEAGSSGSPCFNEDLEWMGLHHSGIAYTKNGGIPIKALVRNWKTKKLDELKIYLP